MHNPTPISGFLKAKAKSVVGRVPENLENNLYSQPWLAANTIAICLNVSYVAIYVSNACNQSLDEKHINKNRLHIKMNVDVKNIIRISYLSSPSGRYRNTRG